MQFTEVEKGEMWVLLLHWEGGEAITVVKAEHLVALLGQPKERGVEDLPIFTEHTQQINPFTQRGLTSPNNKKAI